MEGSDSWQIHVLATDQALVTEFIGELHFVTSLSTSHKWPHGLIVRRNDYMATRKAILKPPDFVLLTGTPNEEEYHTLLASHYLPWGTAPDLVIFTKKLPQSADIHDYQTRRAAFDKFGLFYNTRLSKAYYSSGAGRFKQGATDHDFSPELLIGSLLAQPKQLPGTTMSRSELLTSRFKEMEQEPITHEKPTHLFPTAFGGIETQPHTIYSDEAIQRDKLEWGKNGFQWIEGFMPAARKKITRFLDQQNQAGNQVAQASANISLMQPPGYVYRVPRIRKVEEFVLTENDYRLCCRNTIHTWDHAGTVSEIGNTFHDVKDVLAFNVDNFRTVITILGLRDKDIMQQLLVSGASQQTSNFPLHTICSANLKSSTIYANHLNKQWKASIDKNELTGADPTAQGNAIYDLSSHPLSIPFLIVPMGAAVQHFKEEQYYLHKDGQNCKINCRGVFDGSSPHPKDGESGISPNDHVTIPSELVLPWTSRKTFSWNLAVLSACSYNVSLFHLDYEGAYRQCASRVTERWRQTVFWKCKIHDTIRGGYGEDKKLEWGGTFAANFFNRAITNTTVKWVLFVLEQRWQPTIVDKEVNFWIQNRHLAGFSGQQALPATVDGFLDDYIIALCGNDVDKENGRLWVLTAIKFLDMKLSKSKFIEDGMLREQCSFLGDNYDLVKWTRGIPQHKQDRLMDTLPLLLQDAKWHRKTLESLLGLVESVKGNIPRKWNLLPLYRILHSQDAFYPINEPPEFVNSSATGQKIVQRIMNTLHERQSLFWAPSQWPNPAGTLLDGVSENDACIIHGFGGAIRYGNILFYMAGEWDHVPGFSSIDIFSLECFTILLMVLTLGDTLKGKRIIFRSDSSNTCTTLNKLFSTNPVMNRLAEIWEEMQFQLQFEGMLTWLCGKDNIFSDQASRLPEKEYLIRFRALLDEKQLHNVVLQKLPTIWTSKGFKLYEDYVAMGASSEIHRVKKNREKLAQQISAQRLEDTEQLQHFMTAHAPHELQLHSD